MNGVFAVFADRSEAGRRLAKVLSGTVAPGAVVLGLPRGGVVVAAEVARELELDLDVVVVRKLGVPFQRELAMGAIGEGGARVINEVTIRAAGISEEELRLVEERERTELLRRATVYRAGRPRLRLAGRAAVVVDDGIATGATARAACAVVREQGAAPVVMAAPVAPRHVERDFAGVADRLVSVLSPANFVAIGQWYSDFRPTTDDTVIALLAGVRAPGREVTE